MSVARKGYQTLVLQRDRLQAALLHVVTSRYADAVDVVFNRECASVAFSAGGGGGVTLGMQPTKSTPRNVTDPTEHVRATTTVVGNVERVMVDVVVGADGGRSAVCDFMEEESSGRIKVRRFEDENKRVYKTITLDPPATEPRNLSYGVRTDQELIIESLPTHQDKQIGVLLFRSAPPPRAQTSLNSTVGVMQQRSSDTSALTRRVVVPSTLWSIRLADALRRRPDDQRVLSIQTAEEAKAFFARFFPMLVPYIHEQSYGQFAAQAVSLLPVFKHCGTTLHISNSTVLVGDAIHAVKPYFGLGANSALEDTIVLRRALDASPGDRGRAFAAYSKVPLAPPRPMQTRTRAVRTTAAILVRDIPARASQFGPARASHFSTFLVVVIEDAFLAAGAWARRGGDCRDVAEDGPPGHRRSHPSPESWGPRLCRTA
jgi:kynurenine 3-monooxygenase